MKSKKYWITVVVLLAGFHSYLDRCTATEAKYFYSRENGYSFAVPRGWTELSDKAIQELSLSLSSVSATTKTIETGFERDGNASGLRYPRVVVSVLEYSSFGVNRKITQSELEDLMKSLAGESSQDVHFDFSNATYVSMGMEFEVPDLGKLKSQRVAFFGSYSCVQLTFADLSRNWDNSQPERDLITKSFEFEPDFQCSASIGTSSSNKNDFWSDLIVDITVFGTIGVLLTLSSFLYVILKSIKKEPK